MRAFNKTPAELEADRVRRELQKEAWKDHSAWLIACLFVCRPFACLVAHLFLVLPVCLSACLLVHLSACSSA